MIFCILKLISKLTRKIDCLIRRLSNYFLWNGLIRLYMEVFFEIALASSLNLYFVDWNTHFPSVKYSNILSTAFFIACIMVTLYLIIFYCKNLSRVGEESFIESFGAALESNNVKMTHSRWSIVLYLAFFFGRRIAFIASAILLNKFLWA